MQTPEPVGPAVAPSPAGLRDSLIGALQALFRAFQKSAIYPSGHPSIPEAVQKALCGFSRVLRDQEHVVLGFARDQILFQDEILAETTGALRSLAQLMHNFDLAGLELRRGLDTNEVERLIRFLGEARRERLKGDRLMEALQRESLLYIRAVPIDYQALRFSEGAQRDRGHLSSPSDAWVDLTRALTDPTFSVTEKAMHHLADDLGQQILAQEGAGVGTLRKQLLVSVRKFSGLRGEQRSMARRRLAAFVNGLSGDLQRDLLRVDASKPRAALTVLNEVAEELPMQGLLGALQDIGTSGGRVPDEMLVLLNKLSRISEGKPQETNLLQQTLESWGLSLQAPTLSTDSRALLSEVLHRRHDAEYNPESYRSLLDGLSRENLPGVAQASALRYRDPCDPIDVRMHAAEIAVQLLARPDGDEHRTNLLAYVQNATDFLLQNDAFGTVHEATLAARAHCLLKTDSETTRRAARCFLDEFSRPQRITRVLDNACHGDRVPEDALSLLALGGVTAVNTVLDRLADHPHPGIAEGLRRFARERGAEVLSRIIERRSPGGRVALDPVFTMLRELPTEQAVPLLELLADHEEYMVRCDALLLLIEIDERPGCPEVHLRRAICDRDPRLVSLAIQHLTERATVAALELLGEYVEASLPDVEPLPTISRRAAQHLIQRGEVGLNRLCRALRKLARIPKPRQARLARIVVEVLHPERKHPSARSAILDWRLSLNYLVGLATPRHRLRGSPSEVAS